MTSLIDRAKVKYLPQENTTRFLAPEKMELVIHSGKLFGWSVLKMDCSGMPTHAFA